MSYTRIVSALCLGLVVFLGGCGLAARRPAISPMQKRVLTTKLIEGSHEDTFRAVMTVLQDHGYAIRNTDMDAGLISAYTARQNYGVWGIPTEHGTGFETSCIVTPVSSETTEIRLVIRKSYESRLRFSDRLSDKGPEVYDPEVIQELFNQVTVEVKRRQAIR